MSQVLSHQNIANGTAVPSAETVLATSAVVQAGGGGAPPALAKTIIRGTVNVLAGTGTTAVVLKVRQGTLVTGTQVGASITVTLAAGNNGSIPFSVEDTFALVSQAGGGQYNITLTQTGGSANGSVNFGDLSVEVAP